jgi:hypothetical protein
MSREMIPLQKNGNFPGLSETEDAMIARKQNERSLKRSPNVAIFLLTILSIFLSIEYNSTMLNSLETLDE